MANDEVWHSRLILNPLVLFPLHIGLAVAGGVSLAAQSHALIGGFGVADVRHRSLCAGCAAAPESETATHVGSRKREGCAQRVSSRRRFAPRTMVWCCYL